MQRLDVEFPERPMFPADPDLLADAEAMVAAERPLSSAGYRYTSNSPPVYPHLTDQYPDFEA